MYEEYFLTLQTNRLNKFVQNGRERRTIMPVIQLHIQGLTHHDVAARREAFVQSAVGRRMVLRAAPCREDAWAVAAFVEADMVGYVARTDLDKVWGAMLGMDVRVLRGKVESAKAYSLVFTASVEHVFEGFKITTSLPDSWHYAGPLMPELEMWQRLDYLGEEMEAMLTEERVDDDSVMVLFKAFCKLACYDVSSEMLAMRCRLRDAFAACHGTSLQEAAGRLEELSQRMGGDHGMEAVGLWMKHELPKAREAQAMLREVISDHVRAEAMTMTASLPDGLLTEWRTNATQFARQLYGMHLTRDMLRSVLSCLIWLDNNSLSHTSTAEQSRLQMGLQVWDELMRSLKPIFWGDEAMALEFLTAARKAKPKQITAMVNEWVAAKRISEQSCHRDLGLILHEAGIYTPSESNWNQQVS